MLNQEIIDGLGAFIETARECGRALEEQGQVQRDHNGSFTECYSEDGKWAYMSECYGDRSCGGFEKVSHDGKVVWMLVFYSVVESGTTDIGRVNECLRRAHRNVPPESTSMRGPEEFTFHKEKWSYLCRQHGDIALFHGTESIRSATSLICSSRYSGGFVE